MLGGPLRVPSGADLESDRGEFCDWPVGSHLISVEASSARTAWAMVVVVSSLGRASDLALRAVHGSGTAALTNQQTSRAFGLSSPRSRWVLYQRRAGLAVGSSRSEEPAARPLARADGKVGSSDARTRESKQQVHLLAGNGGPGTNDASSRSRHCRPRRRRSAAGEAELLLVRA